MHVPHPEIAAIRTALGAVVLNTATVNTKVLAIRAQLTRMADAVSADAILSSTDRYLEALRITTENQLEDVLGMNSHILKTYRDTMMAIIRNLG